MSVRKALWIVTRPRRAAGEIRRVRAMRRAEHTLAGAPALCDETVAALDALLGAGARTVIEYGSGSSTLFLAGRGAEVVSVEGDRRFAEAVRAAIKARGLRNAEVLAPDIGPTLEWSFPFDRYPTRRNLARWEGYAAAPWARLAGRDPDLVVVDGRFRKACVAYAALQCLRRGIAPPILIDDWRGRESYHAVRRVVDVERETGRAAIAKVRPGVGAAEIERAFAEWLPDAA